MKKYIIAQGFSYKSNANDMTHKQFYLDTVLYANSENSRMGDFKLDREETYIMFLKEVDGASFQATLEAIINAALNDNVDVVLGNSIAVERQENGYSITMNFIIQGE